MPLEAAPNPVFGAPWFLLEECRGVGRHPPSALGRGLAWSALEFDHPLRARSRERASLCGPGGEPRSAQGWGSRNPGRGPWATCRLGWRNGSWVWAPANAPVAPGPGRPIGARLGSRRRMGSDAKTQRRPRGRGWAEARREAEPGRPGVQPEGVRASRRRELPLPSKASGARELPWRQIRMQTRGATMATHRVSPSNSQQHYL